MSGDAISKISLNTSNSVDADNLQKRKKLLPELAAGAFLQKFSVFLNPNNFAVGDTEKPLFSQGTQSVSSI